MSGEKKPWCLTIVFDSPVAQARRMCPPVGDELLQFVHEVMKHWSPNPDDLDMIDEIQILGRQVRLFPQVLDAIIEPMTWLLMHTIPVQVQLERRVNP